MAVDTKLIGEFLQRRRQGIGRGGRMKIEADQWKFCPGFVSAIR